MKLLAIETSAQACSAALWIDGEIEVRHTLEPQRHAELILTQIDDLLGDAGLHGGALDRLAFGQGPGSFTGVRIATSVIQGLAYGFDLPVVPISSLLALAEGVYRKVGSSGVFPALDARRGEVYIGGFLRSDTRWEIVLNETVCAPSTLPSSDKIKERSDRWVGAGSGWSVYQEPLEEALSVQQTIPALYPEASDVARLAALSSSLAEVDAAQALPVYLRDNIVVRS